MERCRFVVGMMVLLASVQPASGQQTCNQTSCQLFRGVELKEIDLPDIPEQPQRQTQSEPPPARREQPRPAPQALARPEQQAPATAELETRRPLTKSFNQYILEAVSTVRKGGGFSLGGDAVSALRDNMSLSGGRLQVNGALSPSNCATGTYHVLATALAAAQRDGVHLDPRGLEAMRVSGQADGHGVWGRWNANGPGPQVLFHITKSGRNFTSINQAQPGDFVKMFTNDNIGSSESGHLGIFLGTVRRGDTTYLKFFSGNKPDGLGYREWPVGSQIRRLVFGRIEDPGAFVRNSAQFRNDVDPYLSTLLRRPSSVAEMHREIGISGR